MSELEQAREIAIGLGGRITDNDVGFITCFDGEIIAESYVISLEDFQSLLAERQDRCAVVITLASVL